MGTTKGPHGDRADPPFGKGALVKKVLKWAAIGVGAFIALGIVLSLLGCGGGGVPIKQNPDMDAGAEIPATSPSLSPTAAQAGGYSAGDPIVDALVSRVVDGDTIEVEINGTTETIRLIGIDTPETVHPTKPVGCFGPEASAFTKESLTGQTVRLELDVEERDRYGRLLAYVFLGDELFNETLIREGYAVVSTYPPNVKYVDRFTAAQEEARDAGAGFWTACATPSPEPTKTSSAAGGDCDPSYPDVCIPPYSKVGDLDCGDVPYTNFTVLPPDPHGFDRDGDGRGCTG